MSQKDVFLESEGDAWFSRNRIGERPLPQSDPLLLEMVNLPAAALARGTRVLEIGCGEGARLAWLTANRGCECHGIDPSAQAVEAARKRGVSAQQGTADKLPFESNSFDVVTFGFCLYLCDREDLFRIASEADRVLKNPGWLLINDFYSPVPSKRAYHHRSGLFSHKMDYRALFSWHPGYVNYLQRVFDHSTHQCTDDPNEWVAVSVLRKRFE